MSYLYTYSITDDTLASVPTGIANSFDIVPLADSIYEAISVAPMNITVDGDSIKITMPAELSEPDKTSLDGIVAAFNGDPLLPYRTLIENAVNFFHNVMVQFAAENITLGITQAGKTKDVSDYLEKVLRYGQTGSLYEVINEIDSLIASGIPAGLSPYVTDVRMNKVKEKIQSYLS